MTTPGADARFAVPCAELDALAEELALRGVPMRAERTLSGTGMSEDGWETVGWQLVYPSDGGLVSVIWSGFSYGSDLGLLEAWGYDHRHDPRGWLCAGDVLAMYPPEVL